MTKNRTLIYNAAMSIFLPEIIALGDAIAARVPEGHWFRSGIGNRLLGVLAARVKNQAHEEPSPVRAALMFRASSLIRHTARSLRHPPRRFVPKSALDQEWVKKFLQEADERLTNAANPEDELERLKEKFDLFNKLKELTG